MECYVIICRDVQFIPHMFKNSFKYYSQKILQVLPSKIKLSNQYFYNLFEHGCCLHDIMEIKPCVGERRQRRWKEVAQRSDDKGVRNSALNRPDCAPGGSPGRPVEEAGRPPSRPACMSVHRKERSTGPVDRLTKARSRLGEVDRAGRPWHGSVDDRQARLTFLLGFEFLFWMGLNPIWVSLNPGTLWL